MRNLLFVIYWVICIFFRKFNISHRVRLPEDTLLNLSGLLPKDTT